MRSCISDSKEADVVKKLYIGLLCLVLAGLMAFGAVSLFDTDQTVSKFENKKLGEKPKFSLAALFDGSYTAELEQYYTETFPARDAMLEVNRDLNKFYYFSGAQDENLLLIEGSTGAESGGESLDEVEAAVQELQEELIKPAEKDPPSEHQAEEILDEPEPVVEPEEPKPQTYPAENEVSYAGNVMIVGTRAMEIPTATDSIIQGYAEAINNLANAMGESTRVISIVTPNAGEFYSPESMHTGLHSQKAMIDLCYGTMSDEILTVDAYSELAKHTDEYIYFRTDHHWTQLGAYYAYVKFCETAGFEAVPLENFQTGQYDRFVGSMYTFTSGYPQSQTLKDNPDYLQYYLPITESHARYYPNADLIGDGVAVSVVHTSLSEYLDNKYLCYIGGDTPICIVETAAEGGTCILLKESYGNAFVPFLTSHYSKIIVIDPREFNRDGKPALNLQTFAAQQEVDDLIVINYPYMINSKPYTNWLNRMVGMDPNWQ